MKRSKIVKLIAINIRISTGADEDTANLTALDILESIEIAGMSPPDYEIVGLGKYSEWEPEEEKEDQTNNMKTIKELETIWHEAAKTLAQKRDTFYKARQEERKAADLHEQARQDYIHEFERLTGLHDLNDSDDE